jgi:hypothetical protein
MAEAGDVKSALFLASLYHRPNLSCKIHTSPHRVGCPHTYPRMATTFKFRCSEAQLAAWKRAAVASRLGMCSRDAAQRGLCHPRPSLQFVGMGWLTVTTLKRLHQAGGVPSSAIPKQTGTSPSPLPQREGLVLEMAQAGCSWEKIGHMFDISPTRARQIAETSARYVRQCRRSAPQDLRLAVRRTGIRPNGQRASRARPIRVAGSRRVSANSRGSPDDPHPKPEPLTRLPGGRCGVVLEETA